MATSSSNLSNRDIDFLPVAYREVGIQRKNITLRAVVIIAFVALVGFGVAYQQHLRILAQQQLADLLPSYEQAQVELKRLGELQLLSQSIERQAELETYLKHPWPRTQIIAALVDQLPEEVQLDKISIVREPLPVNVNESHLAGVKVGETAQTKLDPAQRDLEAIRGVYDRSRIVVQLADRRTIRWRSIDIWKTSAGANYLRSSKRGALNDSEAMPMIAFSSPRG